jgi:hypothetical protein
MATPLDVQTLRLVFESRPDILANIQRTADTPARTTLFNDIASFVYERLGSGDSQDGPASKRRRIDITQLPTHPQPNGQVHERGLPAASQTVGLNADAAVADPVLLEVKDISVTAPQRKKYDICFTKHFLYARASGTSVPAQGVVYPWKDIGTPLPGLPVSRPLTNC